MNSNPGQKVQTSAPFHKVRSRSKNVLLCGFIVGLLGLVWGVATLNASTFVSATAATEGNGLRIDFVERGLQPGQNYDYVGSFGSATETFQCYHPRTFTPTGRTFEIDSIASYPDVRIYQASARGVVHGFVYVYPVLPPFHGCGKGLETVPIGITFTDFSLVNGVTFDAIYVKGTFSGAIEPDWAVHKLDWLQANGWQCFGGDGVHPYFVEGDAKLIAVEYATARMTSRREQSQIYGLDGVVVEKTLQFDPKRSV